LQVVADEKIFLPRLADHGRGVDRVFAMKNGLGTESSVILPGRKLAVMNS